MHTLRPKSVTASDDNISEKKIMLNYTLFYNTKTVKVKWDKILVKAQTKNDIGPLRIRDIFLLLLILSVFFHNEQQVQNAKCLVT